MSGPRRWIWGVGLTPGPAPPSDVERLSDEFSRVIRHWLDPWELAAAVAENRNIAARGQSHCATHDYCDANMAMEEAFVTVMGYLPDATRHGSDGPLWDAAWVLSKQREFK